MWPYLKVKKYLKTWTLPVFFPFTHLSLLPVSVMTSAPEWGDLVFFPCWFCLCCSVISIFPEEISTKLGWLPGQPVWVGCRKVTPVVNPIFTPHTPHIKLCIYSFISPWLLLSKSARSHGQNIIWIHSRAEKNHRREDKESKLKGNQKVSFSSRQCPLRFATWYWW